MARSRGNKIELTAYDDLFETDESRAEAALSKIREIPIPLNLIAAFSNLFSKLGIAP